MIDIAAIADKADMIINGYAFTKDGDDIRVLNLNGTNRALMINKESKVIETSMDDIEIAIVLDYYRRNRKYLEV